MGSDGIGDTPYFIDIEYIINVTRDNYPLMNPYIPPEEMRVLYYDLLADFDSLNSTYCELLNEYGELLASYNSLNSSYNNLQANYNLLKSTCNELGLKQKATINELNNIRNLMYIFIATTIIFIATTIYLAIRKLKIKP